MTRNKLGVVALIISSAVLVALPTGSVGRDADLRGANDALVQSGQQVRSGLKSTVDKTGKGVARVVERTKSTVRRTTASRQQQAAQTRQTATDPLRQPPLHGTNPHGQGTVGVVDLDPRNDRPYPADTTGRDSGEDVVVGRARGEQVAPGGAYHGHITIAALFGNEIGGVDTVPGETESGPLEGLQTGLLDPLCQSTNQQVCLSLLTANSATTATGSANDFAVARAVLLGIGVGAAESNGTIAQDANCQTAVGASRAANVTSGGTVTATVANAGSMSRSCRGQAPQVTNTSQVIQLGNAGLPIPAPGCAEGTPDTVTGIPGLLPIVCNADEIINNAGVREALDVYALQVGTNSLVKETTAAAESLSVAPPETGTQCVDGVDNDGDGVIDSADPGCHTDGNPNNPNSFDPTDNDERDQGPRDGGDDDDGGDGAGGGGGGGGAGLGGGAGGGAGAGARDADAGNLPFTGTDVLGIGLAGLLMLAGGLLLRRRGDVRTVW